jgi:hypothetical protein
VRELTRVALVPLAEPKARLCPTVRVQLDGEAFPDDVHPLTIDETLHFPTFGHRLFLPQRYAEKR